MLTMIAQHSRPARDGRQLAVVVLAAGASRRLGRPKQLVTLGGEPLVRRVTKRALGLRPQWVGIVIGAHAGRVTAALRGLPVSLVRARHWRCGMGASLCAGVRAAPWAVRHIAVLSVDQWRVSDRDLDRLVRAANRLPAAAAYDGQVGIPAVFPGRMRPWLLALHGDRGARTLLARGPVNAVNMPAAGEDLDTVADLARLRAAGCLGDPGFIRCGRCKGDDS